MAALNFNGHNFNMCFVVGWFKKIHVVYIDLFYVLIFIILLPLVFFHKENTLHHPGDHRNLRVKYKNTQITARDISAHLFYE